MNSDILSANTVNEEGNTINTEYVLDLLCCISTQ